MVKMKHDQTASCRSLHIYGIRRNVLTEQRSLNVFQLWIEYKDPLESFEELQSCWLLPEAGDAHLWLYSGQRAYPSTKLPANQDAEQSLPASISPVSFSFTHFPSSYTLSLSPISPPSPTVRSTRLLSLLFKVLVNSLQKADGHWDHKLLTLAISDRQFAVGPLSFHLFLSVSIFCSLWFYICLCNSMSFS